MNNDGTTEGLTVPSPAGQQDVLRQAYERAQVSAEQVQYVELHGTGTKLGDPIEASALGAVLGDGRVDGAELRVGSVKTNVGHLEGAAGIVGLLKAALCIRHRELVPEGRCPAVRPPVPRSENAGRRHRRTCPRARPVPRGGRSGFRSPAEGARHMSTTEPVSRPGGETVTAAAADAPPGLSPVLGGVDLTDSAGFADGIPYDVLARLRAQAPILFHPPGISVDGEGFWC